jgi:predicted TPR repeat methyltransferase
MTHSSPLPANDVPHEIGPNVMVQQIWERGKALRMAGSAAEAVRVLHRGLAKAPRDYRLHDELGMALSELRRYEEAIGSFLAAFRLKPDCDEVCNKIGVAFLSRGMLEPAVFWFQRARQINPTAITCLHPYGTALVLLGQLQQATGIFNEWTTAEPDNPIARHLSSAALGSRTTPKASADYVRILFDGCAPRFETTLTNLKYCGPQLVLNSLQQVAGACAVDLEILDVGCGTGLVGSLLRPLARRLVGVDLSAGMLQWARSRNVYDELIQAELVEFLRRHPASFDVLAAADVLTYLGDLADFFCHGTRALKPGGVVVIVTEALDDDGTYRLNPTGRFSHNSLYLRNVMETAGLTVDHIRKDTMRHEANMPVPSLVACGRRF